MNKIKSAFAILAASVLLWPLTAHSLNPQKATVTVKVEYTPSAGSGYQFLMDSACMAWGVWFRYGGNIITEDSYEVIEYEDFVYTFPQNLTGGVNNSPRLTAQNTPMSLEVEPGVYDCAMVRAEYNDRFYLVSGIDNRLDDYVFDAGVEYVFTVKADKDGNEIVTREVVAAKDLEVAALTAPQILSTSFGNEEPVKVLLKNNGREDITQFTLTYKLNNNAPVTENVDLYIPAGAQTSYTFNTKADLYMTGDYYFTFIGHLDGDLIVSNDTLEKRVCRVSAVDLPFERNFEGRNAGDPWYVMDMNGDAESWYLDDEHSAGSGKQCAAMFSYMLTSPEYLVTKRPVNLQKGIHHIKFFVQAEYSTEHLDVLFGTEPNPENMQLLASRPQISNWMDFEMQVANFTVPEAGVYYFAFAAHSAPDAYTLYLDDISIEQGVFNGAPDLHLDVIALPISSCALQEGMIGLSITNVGYGDVSQFKVKYRVGSQPEREKTFHQHIGSTENIELILDTMDFSEVGAHKVSVELSVIPGENEFEETELYNNKGERTVYHWEPTTVPFRTDFTKEEDRLQWSHGLWQWNYGEDEQVFWNLDKGPLYSRCMTFDTGKLYRLSLDYIAGESEWGITVTEDFGIYYIEPGDTVWHPIAGKQEAFTQNLFIQEDFKFRVGKPGIYSLAFVCFTAHNSFGLKRAVIEEVTDYDIRALGFDIMPTMIPVELSDAEYDIAVNVQNRGRLGVTEAKVSMTMNGNEVGDKTFFLGNADATATATVPVQVTGSRIGQTNRFTATASIPGHESEDLSDDNEVSIDMLVTDTVLAYDHTQPGQCFDPNNGIGTGGDYPMYMGIPVYVTARDTLTAVQVFWSESDPFAVPVYIYAFDNGGPALGATLYSGEFRKRSEAGPATYAIPAIILEKGCYLITVGVRYTSLIVDDYDPSFVFYSVNNNVLTPLRGWGAPGIRAIFGHGGRPMAKDAAIIDIPAPKSYGYFSANETVTAVVANQGYEALQAKVALRVNGTLVGEKTVSLEGYRRTEVSFTADLSAPLTEYKVAFTVEAEGDGDEENNAMGKIINTMPDPDPYVMNFEYCGDFTVDNFVPAWTTYDGDGERVIVIGSMPMEHFHQDGTCAFAAFNPYVLSVPQVVLDQLGAYEGERFGASFTAGEDVRNDDWLISPKLRLPDKGAKVDLAVKTYIPYGGLEEYNVLVSETGSNPDDFTCVYHGLAPAEAWQKVSVDLSAYNGKDVHVAIQCVSDFQFVFMVDDIRISKPGAANFSPLQSQLRLWPNPARETVTLTATDAAIEYVEVLDMAGRRVYASMQGLKTNTFRYNVGGLQQGLYMMRVTTAQGTAALKFIVK